MPTYTLIQSTAEIPRPALKAPTVRPDNVSAMQDNVDYRLLDRFLANQSLISQPPKPQADQPKRTAAAGGSRRLPAIDLRD